MCEAFAALFAAQDAALSLLLPTLCSQLEDWVATVVDASGAFQQGTHPQAASEESDACIGRSRANHLMTECPRDLLHSKVWRSARMHTALPLQAESTKLPLSGKGQAVTVLWSTERKTGDTGDGALSTFLSHTSSSQGCVRDIKVLFLKSVDTLFMGIKRIDQSMDQPSPGDTPSPSAGRERQESIALHTLSKEDVIGSCRKRRHLTPTRQSPPRASPWRHRSGYRYLGWSQAHRPFHVDSLLLGTHGHLERKA